MGANLKARVDGLQAAVVPGAGYIDPHIDDAARARIIPRVCRIEMMSEGEAPQPEPLGTGFIVGESTVLTNWHVVRAARERGGAGRLSCRFNFAIHAGGVTGQGREVAVNRVVMERKCSAAELTINPDVVPPREDELDFALLELAEPIGAELGVIALPDVQPKTCTNERLYIAQHPAGAAIKIADDAPGVIGLFHSNRRLRYRTRTEGGSSGSPVFTSAWKLVALHHLGDPKYRITGAADYNQGIPIALIVKSIVAAGHGALIAPLEDDLELADDRKSMLVGSIQNFFKIPDYTAVLHRYIGEIGTGSIMPGGVVIDNSSMNAYDTARRGRLLREYLGRVLEQKWSEPKLRKDVLVSVEALARPDNRIDRQSAAITAGLDALLARIDDNDVICVVGPHISSLWILDDHLGRLNLLKRLHEALRDLQVQGADWLAPGPTTAETMTDLPPAKLAEIIQRVVKAAEQARDASTAPHINDPDTIALANENVETLQMIRSLGKLCANLLAPIAQSFATPSHAGTAEARNDLDAMRLLLAGDSSNHPVLSTVAILVFQICRDLPLKALRQAFKAAEALDGNGRAAMRVACRATVELSDALRRRAVEQALWQEIDGWLYEAEKHIAAVPDDFNPVQDQLAILFVKIKTNVARLGAVGNDGKQITDDCQNALHFYRSNLANQVLDNQVELRKNVEDSFAELVLIARSKTHEADLAFFADCAKLMPIGTGILKIYARIALTWALLC